MNVADNMRIIRLGEVIYRTGLGRSSIYAAIEVGTFPKPIKLGLRAVGWLEKDIEAWIQKRIDQTPDYSEEDYDD